MKIEKEYRKDTMKHRMFERSTNVRMLLTNIQRLFSNKFCTTTQLCLTCFECAQLKFGFLRYVFSTIKLYKKSKEKNHTCFSVRLFSVLLNVGLEIIRILREEKSFYKS